MATCGCGELVVGELDALPRLLGIVGDGGESLGRVAGGEGAEALVGGVDRCTRPSSAAPDSARATPARSARAGGARRTRPPCRPDPSLASSQSRMISAFHARVCSSLSAVASSSCCLRVKALLRFSRASWSACSNSTVAASPNCAFAKPSSCSLVFTASSVSTSADAARRASSFTSICSTAGGWPGAPPTFLRRLRTTRTITTMAIAASTRKTISPTGKPPPRRVRRPRHPRSRRPRHPLLRASHRRPARAERPARSRRAVQTTPGLRSRRRCSTPRPSVATASRYCVVPRLFSAAVSSAHCWALVGSVNSST